MVPFRTGISHNVPCLCLFVLSHGFDNGKFERGSLPVATELDWSCLAKNPVIHHFPAKYDIMIIKFTAQPSDEHFRIIILLMYHLLHHVIANCAHTTRAQNYEKSVWLWITEKRVENTTRRGIFLTTFNV